MKSSNKVWKILKLPNDENELNNYIQEYFGTFETPSFYFDVNYATNRFMLIIRDREKSHIILFINKYNFYINFIDRCSFKIVIYLSLYSMPSTLKNRAKSLKMLIFKYTFKNRAKSFKMLIFKYSLKTGENA
jgi:hypothetical protein